MFYRIPVKFKDGVRFAMVDKSDWDQFKDYRWYGVNGYAKRNLTLDGKPRQLYLHREIMNSPTGQDVDHISGNKLDNRRANLRLCSRGQNVCNSKHKGNATGYKGVHYNISRDRYIATIGYNYKTIHIGAFRTLESAAKAYNRYAIEYFGEFAKLNEIPEIF